MAIPNSDLHGGRLPVGVLAACLLALPCCRTAPAAPVRIGLVGYHPDELNSQGTANAVQLAVEEANAAGGLAVGGRRRQVEVRSVPIQEGSPEQAVAAVQRLINQERVCAVLGPQLSDEAIPAGGLADRARIPLVSPLSSLAATTRNRPFVFRACFRDEDQGRALAVFARESLKARTAALLVEVPLVYSRTVAEAFRREFTARGGRIVADEQYLDRDENMGRQLREIRRAAADVLLLPNWSKPVASVGVAARRAGIRSVFLGPDSWSRRHLCPLPEFAGSYMVTNWSRELDTPENARFMAAYSRRFRAEPSETAALTYDAARLLLAAIAASGDGEPASIQKALYGAQDFVGASGPIRFRESGDPEKQTVIVQFKDGTDALARILPPRNGR